MPLSRERAATFVKNREGAIYLLCLSEISFTNATVINCKKGVLMAFVSSSAAAISGAGSAPPDHRAHGAQSLLSAMPPKQHYTAQAVALALYALLIGAALTTAFKPAQVVTEEEQTIELAPMPVDEEPPPPDQAPIEQPEVDDTPPPPMALDPIAPIEEAKPAPKPVEKVEKKVVEKPVERKPAAAPRAVSAAPPGAQVSYGLRLITSGLRFSATSGSRLGF